MGISANEQIKMCLSFYTHFPFHRDMVCVEFYTLASQRTKYIFNILASVLGWINSW